MKPSFLKRQSWFIYLFWAFLLAIVLIFLYPRVAAPYAKEHFIAKWVQIFRDHPSKAELLALPPNDQPNFIFFREFPDGSWVAASSESFHENSLFDATVFIDSSHSVHTSYHHFCGYEGLSGELMEPTASSLPDFYAKLQIAKIDLLLVP